jgi:hypothetical protein
VAVDLRQCVVASVLLRRVAPTERCPDQYSGWDWAVRCYYADDVRPPKVPGDLAVETVHKNATSKDIEVAAAESCADYGRVEVIPLRPDVANG